MALLLKISSFVVPQSNPSDRLAQTDFDNSWLEAGKADDHLTSTS